MNAGEALVKLGGFGTTKQVVRLTSAKRVRTALSRGEILRVGRNRLALATADRAHEAALAVNGWASHLSAAAHHGWETRMQPEMPQVTVPRRRAIESRLPVLVELHRGDIHTSECDGWATSPLRTVMDCANDLPFVDALCVADSALRHGSLTQGNLMATAVTPEQAKVAEYADARAANPFESALRALALEAGLETIPQYEISLGEFVVHPDLANPLLSIALEADSYEFHGRHKWDHNRDCIRYNLLVAAGWRVLRFTWEQVMERPDYVIQTIRALMVEVAA